jgi:MFS family permease
MGAFARESKSFVVCIAPFCLNEHSVCASPAARGPPRRFRRPLSRPVPGEPRPRIARSRTLSTLTVPEHVRRHWPDTLITLSISAAHGGLNTLLPPMFRDEQKGAVVIGALVAVSAMVALVMRLPGGLLYSPARARAVLIGSLGLAAAAAICYPLTVDDRLLTLIGALDGIGFSTATTVNMASMMDDIQPHESRAGAVSFYVAGMSTGFAVSAVCWSAAAEGWGYAAAFWGMAGTYGVAAALVAFVRRYEVAAHPPLAKASGPAWTRARSFGAALLDPLVLFMMLGAFFLNVFLSQFQTFLPLTLLPLGLTLTEVGSMRSAWSLTNTLGRFFGGPILGRVDYRRTQTRGILFQAAMLTLLEFRWPFAGYMVVSILAASGRAICYVANAMALADVHPSKVGRGLASGVLNAAGDLGNILGPVTGGLIASAVGYSRFWLISPLLYAAIYLLALLAISRRAMVAGAPAL